MKLLRNPKYILPNGLEWKGTVHKMDDGEWMTGKVHTPNSIQLALIDEVWNMPRKGAVATQKVLSQVFSYLGKDSGVAEGLLNIFDSKSTKLDILLGSIEELLAVHINKIKKYLDSKIIQTEDGGRGSVVDLSLNLTLDEIRSESKTASISSVDYVHNTEDNYFLWPGNIEAGIYYGSSNNPSSLYKSTSMRLFADMVSRTGASTGLVDPENLKIDNSFVPGFSGEIIIKLDSPETITNVVAPFNTDISTFTINGDPGTIYQINSVLEPTAVSSITLSINNFIEPIPFSSRMSEDLQEDFVGEGPVEDGYVHPEDIYQRTRLEVGPLGLALKKYSLTKETILGPYYCSAGSISSINFNAYESLIGAAPDDQSFNYKLIINSTEYDIVPINRSGTSVHTYRINSVLSEDAKNSPLYTNTSFIDVENPPVSWQLKVTLNSSEESQASPMLEGVNFTYTTSLAGGINV